MIYFASEFSYHFYAYINFVLSQAWLWQLLLSRLSLPHLLLAFTCTEYELNSWIQLPKTKFFQRVHYKFLCMVFQSHSKLIFMCYLSKLSNTPHFVPLFLAHEDIVVGIAIFHIKLSTPRLGSFICSSLILQGSWSELYKRAPMCQNFKELGTALTCLLWKIASPHCQSLAWNNHLSK
jgi:hypothetical protein